MNAWGDPIHHPKQHPDQISYFATIHFADRPTDQQMVQANVPSHEPSARYADRQPRGKIEYQLKKLRK